MAGQSERHGKMKGGKGKVKAGHRGGKGQDRGQCRDRVRVADDTSDWWRSGRNAGARAEGTVGGKTTIGEVRGYDKNWERAR